MEISYGTGLGLQNRYDALIFDNSEDPLEAISKYAKKTKKSKAKKDFQIKTKPKAKSAQAQTKPKDQANSKKTKKNNKAKMAQTAEPEKSLIPAFERLLTLDEYREANKGNLCQAPKFNLRQPGEGEDTIQWGKLVPLKKKYQDEEEEEIEYEASEFPQRAGRLRRLPVRVMFGDSLVRHTTTRRDLNAARVAASVTDSPLQRQRPPKVDNEREFPTLGN